MLKHSLMATFVFVHISEADKCVLENSQVQKNNLVISFLDIHYNSSISKCVLKLFAMDVCSKILDRLGFNSSTE